MFWDFLGFFLRESLSMQIFGLFCKTYSGDLERFKILKDSVDKFNKDKVPFFVVCPALDMDLFSQLKTNNEGYEFKLISDEELLGMGQDEHHKQDWYSQQVIKLEFFKLKLVKHYLSLDSDCYFIRDFYVEDFLFDENTPYVPLTEPMKGAESNFMQLFRTLRPKQEEATWNTGSKTYLNRTGKRFCLNVPPVLSYDVLLHMSENLLKPKKMQFADLIKISPYEYEWYCDYLLKFKPTQFQICTPFFVSFYNETFYQLYRHLGFTQEILSNYYTGLIMHEGWIRDKKFKKSLFGSFVRKCLIVYFYWHEQKYPPKKEGFSFKKFYKKYVTLPLQVFRDKKD